MLLFIERLNANISLITEGILLEREPKEDLSAGEKELTVLNEDERKAYAAIQEMGFKFEQLASAHMLKHVFNEDRVKKEDCDKAWKDSLGMIRNIKLTNEILWVSISMRIPDCPKSLVVRKGWKVVALDEKEGEGKINIGITISTSTKFPPHICN